MLLTGTVLTESHTFILLIKPSVQDIEMSLFLNYHYEISVLWYFKMLFDNLLMLITFFILTRIKNGFSVRFLYIAMINFAYHVFDFGGFIWNFKNDHYLYLLVIGIVTVSELSIIFSRDKARIINIKKAFTIKGKDYRIIYNKKQKP